MQGNIMMNADEGGVRSSEDQWPWIIVLRAEDDGAGDHRHTEKSTLRRILIILSVNG
jgi:hypothetical protein